MDLNRVHDIIKKWKTGKQGIWVAHGEEKKCSMSCMFNVQMLLDEL